jgi:hypothetical protein
MGGFGLVAGEVVAEAAGRRCHPGPGAGLYGESAKFVDFWCETDRWPCRACGNEVGEIVVVEPRTIEAAETGRTAESTARAVVDARTVLVTS